MSARIACRNSVHMADLMPRRSLRRGAGASSGAHCGRSGTSPRAITGPCGPRPRRPADGGGVPGAGGGAGPRSGWKRYTWCVFWSTQMVFAPATVVTVATTAYLFGGILVCNRHVPVGSVRNEDELPGRIPTEGIDAIAVLDRRHDLPRRRVDHDRRAAAA